MIRVMIIGVVMSVLTLVAASTSFGQTLSPTTTPSPTTTVPSGAPSTGFGG